DSRRVPLGASLMVFDRVFHSAFRVSSKLSGANGVPSERQRVEGQWTRAEFPSALRSWSSTVCSIQPSA
ncbi:MAG: hypothetical protein P4L33_11915, partial [Capsulimonadaceae bacterium]|nr:hypothetical protein [Capsulimonadaceae bacterium]